MTRCPTPLAGSGWITCRRRCTILPEGASGRQTGRGACFHGALAYALRGAGPEDWRGTFRLLLPIDTAAAEMEHTHLIAHLADGTRRGPRTQRPVLHTVLGWHPADLAWLTGEHLAKTVEAAIAVMGLGQHQAAWVTHTDTRSEVQLVLVLQDPACRLELPIDLCPRLIFWPHRHNIQLTSLSTS